MSTAVYVNTTTYASTHVATNMLRSIRTIIKLSGLNPARITGQWDVIEDGLATWLASRDLKSVTLEVYDPAGDRTRLAGRFDFEIDYGYYSGGDGDLWLDPGTIEHTVRKNGSFPGRCEYTILADTAAGAPDVAGWRPGTHRPTDGFTRHVTGTAIGGASLGASLSYYARMSM